MSCKERQGKYRNRFTAALLLLVLLAALAGCSGSKNGSSGSAKTSDAKLMETAGTSVAEESAEKADVPSAAKEARTGDVDGDYPEWIFLDDFYRETYIALADAFTQPVMEEMGLLGHVDLDYYGFINSKSMSIRFPFDSGDVETMKQALAHVWKGRDIPLITVPASASYEQAVEFFSAMEYASVSLRMLMLSDKYELPDKFSSLPDVRMLDFSISDHRINESYLLVFPVTEELVLSKVKSFPADFAAAQPKLKKLTLIEYDNEFPYNIDILATLPSLEEVCITDSSGEALEATPELLKIVDALKTMENIKRINGEDKLTYAP